MLIRPQGIVYGKRLSSSNGDWCAVRPWAKARRLARRRKGFLSALRKVRPFGARTALGWVWWSWARTGYRPWPVWGLQVEHAWRACHHAARGQSGAAHALCRSLGYRNRHLWDRGYAGSPWVQAAIAAKCPLCGALEERQQAAGQLGRGAQSLGACTGGQALAELSAAARTRSKELSEVGVVAIR